MIITVAFLLLEGLICSITGISQSNSLRLDSVSLLIVILTSIAGFVELVLVNRDKDRHNSIIVFSYLFRLFLLFWDIYYRDIWKLPGSGADSEMYYSAAINGIISSNYGRGGTYSQFIGQIFKMFGVQRIIAQYVNLLLSIGTMLLIKKITISLKLSENIRKLSLVIIAFIPNYAIISVVLLRESLIIILLTASLYLFITWWDYGKISKLLQAILLSLLASIYHSGAIALLLGYALCVVIYDNKKREFILTKKSLFKAIFMVIFLNVLFVSFGDTFFKKFNQFDSATEIVSSVEEGAGGSGYEAGINIGNPILSLIVNTPIRVFYFIFSPVPWKWRGLNDIIAFLFSAAFYAYSYFMSYKALKQKKCVNRNIIIILLLMALSSAIVFSWGVKNAGTALRHRDKFISVYCVLFVVAYQSVFTNNIQRIKQNYKLKTDFNDEVING